MGKDRVYRREKGDPRKRREMVFYSKRKEPDEPGKNWFPRHKCFRGTFVQGTLTPFFEKRPGGERGPGGKKQGPWATEKRGPGVVLFPIQ